MPRGAVSQVPSPLSQVLGAAAGTCDTNL